MLSDAVFRHRLFFWPTFQWGVEDVSFIIFVIVANIVATTTNVVLVCIPFIYVLVQVVVILVFIVVMLIEVIAVYV